MDKNRQVEIWKAVSRNLPEESGLRMMKHNYKFCNFNFFKNSHCAMAVDLMASKIRVQLYINDKNIYEELVTYKENIHEDLGYQLEWRPSESGEAFRIFTTIEKEGYEMKDLDVLSKEIIDKVVELKEVFVRYLD